MSITKLRVKRRPAGPKCSQPWPMPLANSFSTQRFDRLSTQLRSSSANSAIRLMDTLELRPQAERCLELMRQRLAGLALAVIGAHAEAGDATAVEMADRAAAGVLDRYRDDAAAAIEMTYARTPAGVRAELAGKVCGLVMMHGSVNDPHQRRGCTRALRMAKQPARRVGAGALARRKRIVANLE